MKIILGLIFSFGLLLVICNALRSHNHDLSDNSRSRFQRTNMGSNSQLHHKDQRPPGSYGSNKAIRHQRLAQCSILANFPHTIKIYLDLDRLALFWKIAACYFLLVIQDLLFLKIVDFLLVIFTNFQAKNRLIIFQNNKLQITREILLVIFKILDSRHSGL